MTGNDRGPSRDHHGPSDEAGTARIAQLIVEDFYGDALDLASRNMSTEPSRPLGQQGGDAAAGGRAWRRIPEVAAVRKLASRGTDGRAVRRFLTFISAMERARDATQLWSAGRDLFLERSEVFEPRHVSALGFDALRELLKTTGVRRRHRPDTDAWLRIATSLADGGPSPVRRVIDEGCGDAGELRRDLQTRDADGRARFPMLRGPKIRPMWIQIMANPGGAEIGGPPGIAGTCAGLDPALWFFGRHGCGHCERERARRSFGRACGHCVRFSRS